MMTFHQKIVSFPDIFPIRSYCCQSFLFFGLIASQCPLSMDSVSCTLNIYGFMKVSVKIIQSNFANLGCVPMFRPFLLKIACGLVSKLPLGIPNLEGKEVHKPVVDLQVKTPQGKISHEGHANHT